MGTSPLGPDLRPTAVATVTDLLGRWRQGDPEAKEQLFPLVYGELRRRARQLMARRAPHTLTPTALVHEAFLKLVDAAQARWNDREHFFAVASLAMRQVIVDGARRRMAAKRGGGRPPVTPDEREMRVEERALELVALDAALARLEAADQRLARLVELHFFGGLSFQEVANVLGASESTVKREWRLARAFLHRVLAGAERS